MDRWNNLPELPEDIESYDTEALGRASDYVMDGNVSPADAAWEIEKQKARDFADRWLPTIRMTVKQAS